MITPRRWVQLAFLALVVVGVFHIQGHAERWCPFGAVEGLYGYLKEGNLICSLGVTNFYIFGAVVLSVLLLRRAFCSYACPIGTISEWLRRGAARCGIGPLRVNSQLDRGLSSLKYVALAVILYFTWQAGELVLRGVDPCYALISRHGEDITLWAYVVSGVLVIASLLISVPFCRWLCPLAAVLNPFSRFGWSRIYRKKESCSDCGKCEEACPMAIPMAHEDEVRAARCTSCLECIDACPSSSEAALAWGFASPGRKRSQPWSPRYPARAKLLLVSILLISLGSAVLATYLNPLPSFVWKRGEAPEDVTTVELQIDQLTCRGRAQLLRYYLERDDELQVSAYLRLEAWPGPGHARTRITFDPRQTNAQAIRLSITEPYFDLAAGIWRMPPFGIAGYDPLAPR